MKGQGSGIPCPPPIVSCPLRPGGRAATFAVCGGWFAPALVLGLTLSGLFGWALWSLLLQWAPLRQSYLRHTVAIDALFAALLAIFALLLLVN